MGNIDYISNSSEEFFHVRVLTGVVVSLCMSRLLASVAGFIQHPKDKKYNKIQLLWTLNLIFWMMRWWWIILDLKESVVFNYYIYIMIVFYSSLHFFIVFLITPDDIDEYYSFEEYFNRVIKIIYIICIIISSDCFLLFEFDTKSLFSFLFYSSIFLFKSSAYIIAIMYKSMQFQQLFITILLVFSAVDILLEFLI